MDSASIQARRLFTLPAKTGRINIHHGGGNDAQTSFLSNNNNKNTKRPSSSSRGKPSAEVLAFLEQAEERGIQKRKRILSSKNNLFVNSSLALDDEDESLAFSSSVVSGKNHPTSPVLMGGKIDINNDEIENENNKRRRSSLMSQQSTLLLPSNTNDGNNSNNNESFVLVPVPPAAKLSPSPKFQHNNQTNRRPSSTPASQYHHHPKKPTKRAAKKGLAASSINAMKNNEEVLRHDSKHISVFDPPRKMKDLDRNLNSMANEISKSHDGRRNHFLSDQLKVMEEMQIQLKLRREREEKERLERIQQKEAAEEQQQQQQQMMLMMAASANGSGVSGGGDEASSKQSLVTAALHRHSLISDYYPTNYSIAENTSNISNLLLMSNSINQNNNNVNRRRSTLISEDGTNNNTIGGEGSNVSFTPRRLQHQIHHQTNVSASAATTNTPKLRDHTFYMTHTSSSSPPHHHPKMTNNTTDETATLETRSNATSTTIQTSSRQHQKSSNPLKSFTVVGAKRKRSMVSNSGNNNRKGNKSDPFANFDDDNTSGFGNFSSSTLNSASYRMPTFKPLPKPPLQSAPWSKHLSHHTWEQLTPRTKHLAETAALVDVSNEDQARKERDEKKGEKSAMFLRMMRRGTNAVSFTRSLVLKRQNTMRSTTNTNNTYTSKTYNTTNTSTTSDVAPHRTFG